jgi:homoserine dehydrogenase
MQAADKPGVLAVVSDTFAKHDISIEAVSQKEPASGASSVHLVMLTQTCIEAELDVAIAEVEALDAIEGGVTRIRVEHLD